MRIGALFLVLLVLALPLNARQDDGIVRATSVEVVFPQAIRFGLDLTIPASELAYIELRVTPGDGARIVFETDPRDAAIVFDEPEARLRYDWIFTPEQSPKWFDSIRYEWSFILNDGRTAAYAGEFVFFDPREEWVTLEDPNGAYRVTLSRRVIRAGLDFPTIYEQFRQNTGSAPRLDWVLYPSDLNPGCIRTITEDEQEDFTATGSLTGHTLPCMPESLEGVMQGWQLFQLLPSIPADQQVAHWLVDEFYEDAWRGKGVPDWFRAGLGLFYSPSNKAVLLPITRELVRTRRTISAQAMRVRQASQEWQAQSYGMMAYIVDQIGILGVLRMANLIASTPDFSTAYQQLMEQEVETLIPVYERWVFSREAEAAFGVTPYQPPSPTPTVTASASLTATFTPSATLTYTPTPTITGVITRTVAPTITPMSSRTPRPPSVTPRPPGSLQTPTPVPIPAAPSILEQPTIRVGSFVILAILLVVLVILLIRSGGKR